MYKRQVPVQPIVVLSEEEKNQVKLFAEKNHLQNYKEVILFECAPSSGQSLVNVNFAIGIATQMTKSQTDCCFILSSPTAINSNNARIIDASELSFRENAELSKYCSFLIGCSSGITWICSSSAAKQLNTLQLLNKNSGIYAGLNFDLAAWQLPNGHVVEMTEYNQDKVMQCLQSYFNNGLETCRKQYNQTYQPNLMHLYTVAGFMHDNGEDFKSIFAFAHRYCESNAKLNNPIHFNKWQLGLHLIVRRVKSRFGG